MPAQSIFDLPEKVTDLNKLYGDVTNAKYVRVSATRNIQQDAFPSSDIHLKFNVSGKRWWKPKASYLRMRVRLSEFPEGGLEMRDGVAPDQNMMASLFSSAEFLINDVTVAKVSNHLAKICAVKTRLTEDCCWFEAQKRDNIWDSEFSSRLATTAFDGIVRDTTQSIYGYEGAPSAVRGIGGFFDAPAAATSNTLEYDDLTQTITFTANGGDALPDLDIAFPIGSYIGITSIVGASATDPRLNSRSRVLRQPSATTLVIEDNIGANIGEDSENEWVRYDEALQPVNEARRKTTFELTLHPNFLSVFNIDHALPQGKYELRLQPFANVAYQTRAVETNKSLVAKIPNVDYVFEVQDMYLMVQELEGPRYNNGTYFLDLDEMRAQTATINSASLTQHDFTLPQYTIGLAFAYADGRENDSRISSSKLVSYGVEAGGVIPAEEQQAKLNRFFFQYRGQSRPVIDASPEFNVLSSIDYTMDLYMKTQEYSGQIRNGMESHKDWLLRGPIYYWATPTDGSDNSTRLLVSQQFDATNAEMSNTQLYVFSISKVAVQVDVVDGRVESVTRLAG